MSHLHIFKSKNFELYIFSSSRDWCWSTFLDLGIFQHPVSKIIKINKNVITGEKACEIYKLSNMG